MYTNEVNIELKMVHSWLASHTQQDESQSRGFEILPERKAKVQTYVNLIEKGREKDRKKEDKKETTEEEEVIYCLCKSSDCSTFMM